MKKVSALFTAGAAASLLLATNAASAGTAGAYRGTTDSVQGAWQVEVTVRMPAQDCTTSPPVPFGPNPFPSFNIFHEGGTMNEHGSRVSPASRSPGFGVWEQTGRNSFAYRDMFHSFDENGFLSATMDIRSDLKLSKDGQTFKGVSRFALTDISGNIQNFCATLTGEQITL